MNKNLKDLISHIVEKDLSDKELFLILSYLNEYRKSYVDFVLSTTPESESLARWRMKDKKEDWRNVCKTFKLPYTDPGQLID